MDQTPTSGSPELSAGSVSDSAYPRFSHRHWSRKSAVHRTANVRAARRSCSNRNSSSTFTKVLACAGSNARPTKTMALLEQLAGAALMIVALLDFFLTVLYARAG